MGKTKKRPLPFRVGQRVRVPLPPKGAIGVVVEEMGPFGTGGGRLFRVEVPMDLDDPMQMALSEEEMQSLKNEREGLEPLEKDQVIEYLRDWGLMSILRSNEGGKLQPRVWLCRNALGNVTHTFYQERGVVGGQTPPYDAYRGDRIWAPKRDEVLAFVKSFGLTDDKARAVADAVGTAP